MSYFLRIYTKEDIVVWKQVLVPSVTSLSLPLISLELWVTVPMHFESILIEASTALLCYFGSGLSLKLQIFTQSKHRAALRIILV